MRTELEKQCEAVLRLLECGSHVFEKMLPGLKESGMPLDEAWAHIAHMSNTPLVEQRKLLEMMFAFDPEALWREWFGCRPIESMFAHSNIMALRMTQKHFGDRLLDALSYSPSFFHKFCVDNPRITNDDQSLLIWLSEMPIQATSVQTKECILKSLFNATAHLYITNGPLPVTVIQTINEIIKKCSDVLHESFLNETVTISDNNVFSDNYCLRFISDWRIWDTHDQQNDQRKYDVPELEISIARMILLSPPEIKEEIFKHVSEAKAIIKSNSNDSNGHGMLVFIGKLLFSDLPGISWGDVTKAIGGGLDPFDKQNNMPFIVGLYRMNHIFHHSLKSIGFDFKSAIANLPVPIAFNNEDQDFFFKTLMPYVIHSAKNNIKNLNNHRGVIALELLKPKYLDDLVSLGLLAENHKETLTHYHNLSLSEKLVDQTSLHESAIMMMETHESPQARAKRRI